MKEIRFIVAYTLVVLLASFFISLKKVTPAWGFDVYQSTSPASGTTSGVLCSTGTIAYLYSVCTSSPSVSFSSTTVYASTFTSTQRQNTGPVTTATYGCIPFQANYGANGLFYTKATGAQVTYAYGCN